MSNNKNIDYLSRLPSELLQEIYDELEPSDRALRDPLARLFVPFQRLSLYRFVTLGSYEQLDNFCRTVQRIDGAAKTVCELKIEVPFQGTVQESEDPLIPSEEEVTNVFNSMDQLLELHIIGSSRLASLFLSPAEEVSFFPQLEELKLVSSFSDRGDPFDPAYTNSLFKYPDMSHFHLEVRRRPQSIRTSLHQLPPVVKPDNSILVASLVGPLSSSKDSVKSIVSSIGYMMNLTLVDWSPESHIGELLEAAEEPDRHNLLYLYAPRLSPLSESRIITALAKFSKLEFLILDGACSSLLPSFYSTLASLPLKAILFHPGTDVNLTELERLLIEPVKLKALKRIWLENVKGKIGTRIVEDKQGEPYMDGVDGEMGIYPDWELPEWTEHFTRRGLKSFVRTAEKAGVKVGGKAIQALEVEELYDIEMEESLRLNLRKRLTEIVAAEIEAEGSKVSNIWFI
ncbi:hypothetical protein JCM5350_001267 [Sporobolomyces pararoseus]